MIIYFKGGDTRDSSRFEPSQLPQMSDRVEFDQCTEDVIVNEIPMWGELKIGNFKGKIIYCISDKQLNGIILNEDMDTIFNYMTHIKRID